MRLLYIGIWSLFACGVSHGQQSITPSVHNLAGMDVTISNTVISSSVGEPAILTLSSASDVITQGFLQPEVLPCIDIDFRYYPNPAMDIITIEAFGCEIRIRSMTLIDLWGRVLARPILNKKNELDMGDLSPGMYFVKVELTNSETHTINVIKVSN